MSSPGHTGKISLLQLLCNSRPHEDKESLYARIVCGDIRVSGVPERDPKALVPVNADITEVRKAFVSRGGEKLDHALSMWKIDVAGKVFVDAGASTGGFTDCLLQRGASLVHAVDVGYNQLAYALRQDPRVIVHERFNIMSDRDYDPRPHAATADLSFRSIRGAASRLLAITTESWAVVLAKPQFEVREKRDVFDGIVKDADQLRTTLLDLVDDLSDEGVSVRRLIESPIKGRKGNREFLMFITSGEAGVGDDVAAYINDLQGE